MNKFFRKQIIIIVEIIALVLLNIPVFAQSLNPPFSHSTVISDYGPRNVTIGSWFHRGIDYEVAKGNPIPAVEGGEITDIRVFGGGAGWGVEVTGTSGVWWYFHTFEDGTVNLTSTITVGGFVLGKDTTGYYIHRPAIGQWPAKQLRGDPPTSVSVREPIAPVGDSGIGGAHLDLRLNQGDDNPLLHVKHPPDGNFTCAFSNPPAIIGASQLQNPIPINVRVNSRSGLDLNKVELLMDNNLITTFNYGGRTGESPTTNALTSAGQTVSGITYRISPFSATPGYDDFIIEGYDFTSLSEGQHTITIRATDVNNNPYFEAMHQFTIDKTTPTVSIDLQDNDPKKKVMWRINSHLGSAVSVQYIKGYQKIKFNGNDNLTGPSDLKYSFKVIMTRPNNAVIKGWTNFSNIDYWIFYSSLPFSAGEEEYYIHTKSKDKAGNISSSAYKVYTINTATASSTATVPYSNQLPGSPAFNEPVDESESVADASNGSYPETQEIVMKDPVGVLARGYFDGMALLVNQVKEPYELISAGSDFNTISEKVYPVIVIPSEERGRPLFSKCETRNSKYETLNNLKIQMTKIQKTLLPTP